MSEEETTVKLLSDFWNWMHYEWHYSGCDGCCSSDNESFKEYAVKFIQSRTVVSTSQIDKSEWISILDRLPIQIPENWETLDWVLVTTDSHPHPITIARWSNKKWDFLDTNDSWTYGAFGGDCTSTIDADDISHWMPLPAPPKI